MLRRRFPFIPPHIRALVVGFNGRKSFRRCYNAIGIYVALFVGRDRCMSMGVMECSESVFSVVFVHKPFVDH